ncbi:MAG: hypothetical protein J7L14_03575 [Candidatus Diapherotrites archaeon]|nr:hypothetical protein [Candidatus Diapherotrites archaeon]
MNITVLKYFSVFCCIEKILKAHVKEKWIERTNLLTSGVITALACLLLRIGYPILGMVVFMYAFLSCIVWMISIPSKLEPCLFIDCCTCSVTQEVFEKLCLKALHKTCDTYRAFSASKKKKPGEWKKEIEK